MAGCYNGFVYHTKFDRFKVISRGALQNTGDNVLSLVRSISNAEEMYDTEVGYRNNSAYLTSMSYIYLSPGSLKGSFGFL